MIGRLRNWGTLDKLTAVADALFKITALVAALAAANFFFLRPDVELTTTAQAFIDDNLLRQSYAADNRPFPPLVLQVAREYNERNEKDLRSGTNATLGDIPAADLCTRMGRTVERVFADTDCAAPKVRIGRGRFYERRLLDLNDRAGRPLGVADLRDAVERIRTAEYRRARCTTDNVGSAKAINIRIRVSDGFSRPPNQANDPFSLEPDDKPFHRDFETARGARSRDPEIQFGVDWDRGNLATSTASVVAAAVLLFLLLLVLVNDFVRTPPAKDE